MDDDPDQNSLAAEIEHLLRRINLYRHPDLVPTWLFDQYITAINAYDAARLTAYLYGYPRER